jgi:addiction module HigA family antidote
MGRHGRYHETLTRRFIAGGFPARGAKPGAAAAAAPKNAPPRPALPEPPPERFAPVKAARARLDPLRHPARLQEFPSQERGAMTPHPGQVLAQHLADLGLTATDLARDIDVPVNRVTAIINGQRGVTADTALRLGHWFGSDPEDWLGLQLEYELALARRELGAKLKKLSRLADRVA